MQNRKQTRTVLNPEQLQILSAALNKAIYQTNEAIAQLVKDTGLTSAQVKTWFDNRRRVLRQNEFERQRIAVERHHGDSFYDPIYVDSDAATDENSYKTVRELWEDESARRHSRSLDPSSEIPVDFSGSSRGSTGSWVAEAIYWDDVGRLKEPPTDDMEKVDEDDYLDRWEYNQPGDEFDDGDVGDAVSQNGDHSSESKEEKEILE
ncbi:hypothetical protein F5051DRAFT_426206 [Lentinula edodes]|nr:hypothetical protein F5051DRAFT_426206 [Lentinula edodes]